MKYFFILTICYFFPLFGFGKENFDAQYVKVESEELYGAIERCVHTVLPTEDYAIYEHKIPNDLAESGRAQSIYFILDIDKKPLLVVKTLSLDNIDEKIDFEDEVQAIQQMSSLSLKHSHPVEALVFGEFLVDGEKRGFIAEEVAKGGSINSMLSHYSKNKRYLNDAMIKTAKAMAEIHNKKHLSSMNGFYSRLYNQIQIDLDQNVTRKYPGPYGYIHGDMHPGNIFYDPKSKQVSLIDFSSHPASRKGAPVALDPARFLVTFEFLAAFHNIPQKEIDHYTTLFKETYLKANPDLSESTLNLYTTLSLQEFNDNFSDPTFAHNQAAFIHNYTSEKLAHLT